MPGIVGLISRLPREEAERELFQMVGAMRHEYFYVSGTWSDDALGIYVGWVARQSSFSDSMPLQSETANNILVFSGEEFPEPGTIERLRAHGHQFNGEGPSYLVHIAEEDPSFPANLNGRFHGLLVDRRRGLATLFTDRYGMHRLYFHQSADAFYFAAEAKAILAVRPELRRLDPRGLGEFIACGAVMENRTLFDAIQLVPQAAAWVFRYGALERKGSYFNPRDWENQESLDAESFYTRFRETFVGNLPRYFAGNEKIGMSLTGGWDTRMILAWQNWPAGSLPCYTFGSMMRDCQDVVLARRLAGMCGQTHQVIHAGEEFLSQFPNYAERAVYLSDGCADVSRAPDVYINEKAREIAPVRMTGNYGGEVLRRVRTFKPELPLPGLYQGDLLSYVDNARKTYAANMDGHPASLAVFKQLPWNHYGILAVEESRLSMRTPFLDNDFVRTVFRAPAQVFNTNDISIRLITDGRSELMQVPTDRGLAGGRGRLGEAVAHGILQFLFKAEYAYDMGMPQWVASADHLFSALHFERLFLGRHKAFHFRIWYRDYLSAYLKEMLLDSRSLARPYIERKGLEAIVRGHLRGTHNYTNEFHKVLSLEIFHRLFLDEPEKKSHPWGCRIPVAASSS